MGNKCSVFQEASMATVGKRQDASVLFVAMRLKKGRMSAAVSITHLR